MRYFKIVSERTGEQTSFKKHKIYTNFLYALPLF
jgi:hypothetical protein